MGKQVGAGRKRKPTYLHIVQGTAQPCRMNKNEPTPQAELPKPPRILSKLARKIFKRITRRIEGIGIASATDTDILSILAMRIEEIELCDKEILERGATYARVELIYVPEIDAEGNRIVITKAQKRWYSNPAVAQRSEAMRHAQSLLAEFGLSPASRAKVSAIPKSSEPTGNRWSQIAQS